MRQIQIFRCILKARLVEAGAEDRASVSQFGFRSGSGTLDAVLILRRKIETAMSQRDGKLAILALDWQRAFDSVDLDAMVVGSSRFCVPTEILHIIVDIYSRRRFKVIN